MAEVGAGGCCDLPAPAGGRALFMCPASPGAPPPGLDPGVGPPGRPGIVRGKGRVERKGEPWQGLAFPHWEPRDVPRGVGRLCPPGWLR